jgi:hypothetical protein
VPLASTCVQGLGGPHAAPQPVDQHRGRGARGVVAGVAQDDHHEGGACAGGRGLRGRPRLQRLQDMGSALGAGETGVKAAKEQPGWNGSRAEVGREARAGSPSSHLPTTQSRAPGAHNAYPATSTTNTRRGQQRPPGQGLTEVARHRGAHKQNKHMDTQPRDNAQRCWHTLKHPAGACRSASAARTRASEAEGGAGGLTDLRRVGLTPSPAGEGVSGDELRLKRGKGGAHKPCAEEHRDGNQEGVPQHFFKCGGFWGG